MTKAVQSQAAAVSNLANLDTPGYKTRESFAEALTSQLQPGALTRSDSKHLAGPASDAGAGVRETEGLAARRDGNNVQLDRELLALSRASGDFTKAQTALAAKFRLVRYAINEGR